MSCNFCHASIRTEEILCLPFVRLTGSVTAMQDHFRLGIYTSSSKKTVMSVIPLLEASAGPGPRLFHRPELVLSREHTDPAPASHIEAGGNEWDTVKPLAKWFRCRHRTLLFDDDTYKVRPTKHDTECRLDLPCLLKNDHPHGMDCTEPFIPSPRLGLAALL